RGAADRRTKIEIPKVGAAWNAADRRDIAVAELVTANARLDILADIGSTCRVIGAKRHPAMDVIGIPRAWERYWGAGPSLCPNRVGSIAGRIFVREKDS